MKTRAFPNEKIFPWIVLGLLLLSFGILIPRLGFYFDDWPVITNIHLRNIGTFWEFHRSDRPVAAWTYILAGPILNTYPLAWQFFSILMRWLAVLGMWWLVRGLWPMQKREAMWMALLFAIFPAFDQQAISVAYSQHWMIYTFFFVSMGAMLQAERDSHHFWLWTSLALAAMLIHIFSMEYFAGLELLRPLFLFKLAGEIKTQQARRIYYSLKRWLPYLVILIIFVYWRLVIYPQTRGDPNNPSLLFELFSQPISTLATLSQYLVQDFLNILIGSWYKTVDPSTYVLTDQIVLFSIAIAIFTGGCVYFYLKASSQDREEKSNLDFIHGSFLSEGFVFGLLGVILGVLPVWLTGRQTTLGLYGSRFALASMMGASILTIAILQWLTPRVIVRIILLSLLISLATGFHIRRVEIFQRSWIKQSRFYWQLFWRAPDLKSGAAVAADGELFLYVGRSSTALTLNIIYPEDLSYPGIGHYFYELPPTIDRQIEEFVKGRPIEWKFRNFTFNGSTKDIVLIYYEPEQGNCLWVLDPTDVDNPDLSVIAANGLEVSNLNVIEQESRPDVGLPASIFGPEPEHTWCYFFQKADLARQFGNWEEVAELGDTAQELRHSPNNPQEWLPFIEGYARIGRWEDAFEKTLHVRKVNFKVVPRLCRLWARVLSDSPIPPENMMEYQSMMNRLECSDH